jgi:hypothetical protein
MGLKSGIKFYAQESYLMYDLPVKSGREHLATVIGMTRNPICRERRINHALSLKMKVLSPKVKNNIKMIALGLIETWFITR